MNMSIFIGQILINHYASNWLDTFSYVLCSLLTLFSKLTFLILSETFQSIKGLRLRSTFWVQTVCKDYQQTTEVANSKERVNILHI